MLTLLGFSTIYATTYEFRPVLPPMDLVRLSHPHLHTIFHDDLLVMTQLICGGPLASLNCMWEEITYCVECSNPCIHPVLEDCADHHHYTNDHLPQPIITINAKYPLFPGPICQLHDA